MNNLKIAALTGLILLLFATVSFGQDKHAKHMREVRKVQYEHSYEANQKNWYKDEKSRLKTARRETKQQGNLAKASARKVEKLAKLRSQISKTSTGKGGTNE